MVHLNRRQFILHSESIIKKFKDKKGMPKFHEGIKCNFNNKYVENLFELISYL